MGSHVRHCRRTILSYRDDGDLASALTDPRLTRGERSSAKLITLLTGAGGGGWERDRIQLSLEVQVNDGQCTEAARQERTDRVFCVKRERQIAGEQDLGLASEAH